MLWDRLPKSCYVSFSQLELGVYDAVANFNILRKASEKLNMIPGKYAYLKGCQSINAKLLFASTYKNRDTTVQKNVEK